MGLTLSQLCEGQTGCYKVGTGQHSQYHDCCLRKPVFHPWLNKISASERRRYICNVFAHCPRHCAVIGRKRAVMTQLINGESIACQTRRHLWTDQQLFYPSMGLLPDTWNYGLRMRRECRERFPRHRGSAIPTCISARASRTCRDACRDR